ncbi:hypothetical protein Pelo_277 [Pelomyxa schiedti]|nr:hypothetical protein Pelo_277 [Pelomyxa schiedti]
MKKTATQSPKTPQKGEKAERTEKKISHGGIRWGVVWYYTVWVAFVAVYAAFTVLLVENIRQEGTNVRTPTKRAAAAIEALRVVKPSKFNYSYVFMLTASVAFHAQAIARRDWSAIAASIMFLATDFFNEIVNALLYHFSNYSACWVATPGNTIFQILIGWNAEILLTFSISGLILSWLLPTQSHAKFLLIPVDLIICCILAGFATAVELLLLHPFEALTWDFEWWNIGNMPALNIFLFGYLHFFVLATWVRNIPYTWLKLTIPITFLLLDLLAFCYFGPIALHWI